MQAEFCVADDCARLAISPDAGQANHWRRPCWSKDVGPRTGSRCRPKTHKGGFVRQASTFRNWVTPDGAPGPTGEGGFAAEAGRYHLYVALICPWASRTLIARKLKGLEEAIAISVVEPAMTEQGWRFGDYPGSTVELDQRRDLSARDLHPRRPPLHRPRHGAGAVGQAEAHDRQQRIGRHHPHVQFRLRRPRQIATRSLSI